MEEHEKNGQPAAAAGPSGAAEDAAATPVTGGPPPSEPVIELASIESPSLAPSNVGPTGVDAADVGEPEFASKAASTFAGKPSKTFDGIKPKSARRSGPTAGEMILVPEIEAKHAAPRFSKFTLLAASIVLASAFGAMAGALGASGIARLAPLFGAETAAKKQPQSVRTAIAQLRTEMAALKTSVDATNRNVTSQLGKLAERIDRAQSELAARPTKTSDSLERHPDTVAAKDTTGSIAPPPLTSAAPMPPAVLPPAPIVPGWVLRDVYRGNAILQGRMGAMVEVAPGDVLPGLGRIDSIRRQDGHWVVFTSHGMITSMR